MGNFMEKKKDCENFGRLILLSTGFLLLFTAYMTA